MERALKPCKYKGCNKLTRSKEGYCKEHIQEYLDRIEENKKKRMKQYDENRKGSKYRVFYNSKLWRNKREYILARDNYICQDCKRHLAEHVHHIEEIKDSWYSRLDNNNLISLCLECHNKRHNRF